jgi:hypothetical protein
VKQILLKVFGGNKMELKKKGFGFVVDITNNISITILKDGAIHIHMKKHEPLVISAEDKYRKGVELDICSKCKCPSLIQMWDYKPKRKFCADCSLEVLEDQYTTTMRGKVK